MDFTKPAPVQRPRLMKQGDLVIVYERHDQLDHIYLKRGKVYDNRFGSFHHDDMIGKPFGSRIKSRHTPGFVHILEPTPELWSSAVHVSSIILLQSLIILIIYVLSSFIRQERKL